MDEMPMCTGQRCLLIIVYFLLWIVATSNLKGFGSCDSTHCNPFLLIL